MIDFIIRKIDSRYLNVEIGYGDTKHGIGLLNKAEARELMDNLLDAVRELNVELEEV